MGILHIVICSAAITTGTVILSSCTSSLPTVPSTKQNCYDISPLRVNAGEGVAVQPGLGMSMNLCAPKPNTLTVEQCINQVRSSRLQGGGKLVFEENSIHSACEGAVRRGPQSR